MTFKEAWNAIENLIRKYSTGNYDGIIVKKLGSSNTLDEGRSTNQTHIAITGEQMDFFPYLHADGYFMPSYSQRDEDLKKYFTLRVPITIYKKNVEELTDDLSRFPFGNEIKITTYACVFRSRRNDQADQIQLSLTNMDDGVFVKFRKTIHEGDYLVMLKQKESLAYDCIAVKKTDVLAGELVELNNHFYKDSTFTPVDAETLINESSHDFEEENDEVLDEYQRAANILKEYLETNDVSVTERSDIEKTREDFINRFGPNILKALTDDELLEKIFYTVGDNTNSLCCWIEMNKECRAHFGSISGGSAYKFGLFQRQDNGNWQTGSAPKPIDLSKEEALVRGKAIRDSLVKGCEIIENALLETLEDYENLNEKLKDEISNDYAYYNWAWFHKYFSIIFPEKLSSYHNKEWQYHILRCFGIKPSDKDYARSGQISMIQRKGNWVYRQFADIMMQRFGGIKSFIRIGCSDDEKGYASEWIKDSIVGIGWPAIGALDEFKDEEGRLDKEAISERLKEAYYPSDARTASRKAGELIRFYESNSDSIFVAMEGERLIGFVDKLGEYSYDDSSNMSNIKPGVWHTPFKEDDRLPNKSEGLRTSCVQIKDDENLMYLYKKYYYGGSEEGEVENNMSDLRLKNCMQIEREPRTDSLHPMNLIIYGAPGTGKTYSTAEYAIAIIENRDLDLRKKTTEERKQVMKKYNDLIRQGRIVFTTFHQSYGYEEFIQGLRPDTNSDKMSFKTVDGIFKHIADVALNDLENNYVIIIDEINRAHISKVCGEWITLIEEDKRWGEVNETCATLQSGDIFAVPNNLYIVGTMNSADKSISLIDAALRRRFDFVEQKPDPDLIDDPKLKAVLSKMNAKLADELDSSDLLIGHSYFMNKTESSLPSVLNNNIIPLLYEYFYDNKKKVANVLDYSIGDINVEILDDKMGRLSVKKKDN